MQRVSGKQFALHVAVYEECAVAIQGKTIKQIAGGSAAPVCGVIMPISDTATHTEQHWQSVQTLLHRAIKQAGFEPRNVWESAATDRISERIIGNIFEVPILVADITDLNPNVMLELGLRLASKKPTIVIATIGSIIPFDIRDFHATFYPADTNMLGMEEFFRRLLRVLQDKMEAFTGGNYTPFLGSVIVDVASPETREVGANDLLLSRFEEVSRRLSAIEVSVKSSMNVSSAGRVQLFPNVNQSGSFIVYMPADKMDEFAAAALELFEVDKVLKVRNKDNTVTLRVHYSRANNVLVLESALSTLAASFGGDVEVPF